MQSANLTLATVALEAWERGERGDGYDAFRDLVSPNFETFNHPFVGRAEGEKARDALFGLIAEREQVPNSLTFRNPRYYSRENEVVVLFDSLGSVGKDGAIRYDGPVVIIFEFRDGQIVGFKEFLGLVNPSWFA